MVRRIAAVVVFSIALIGPVEAVSGVAPTNLTIHVKGGRVFGMLTGPPVCRAGQTVDLVVNGLEQGSTTTDGLGRYEFNYEAAAGSQIRTEFDGAVVGVHPDTTVCRGSVSRTIVVAGVSPAGGTTGNGAAVVPPGAAFTGVEITTASAVAIVALAVGASLLVLAGPRRSRPSPQ